MGFGTSLNIVCNCITGQEWFRAPYQRTIVVFRLSPQQVEKITMNR